jgi:hypothetical protein
MRQVYVWAYLLPNLELQRDDPNQDVIASATVKRSAVVSFGEQRNTEASTVTRGVEVVGRIHVLLSRTIVCRGGLPPSAPVVRRAGDGRSDDAFGMAARLHRQCERTFSASPASAKLKLLTPSLMPSWAFAGAAMHCRSFDPLKELR